jgi:DNA-binding LytR/AlgR family response regulator
MQYSYVFIQGETSLPNLNNYLNVYDDLLCIGNYDNYEEALNKILERKPNLVFFQVSNKIPLSFISELLEYVDKLPYFIVLSENTDLAYYCIKKGVADYLTTPLSEIEIRKSYLKFKKKNASLEKKIICIKSNGDYNFIEVNTIVYLKADNNTTDFYLKNGKIITAFKTLKCFEESLPFYFFRIHNSFIVNSNYVSRINLGKSKCYLSNNEIIVSFSRTYKENIETIISKIAN